MSNIAFTLMVTIGMPIRNFFMPPEKMFTEIEIRPGEHVLDFGCGPGTFTLMAAEKTGPLGIVYTLDIHPLAIKTVEKKTLNKKLANVKTILSSCPTSLPDESLDAIIFFDVFHILDNQNEVLRELHRVLKQGAVMYFSDHHMKEEHITAKLAEKGLFKLEGKGERTFRFCKV